MPKPEKPVTLVDETLMHVPPSQQTCQGPVAKPGEPIAMPEPEVSGPEPAPTAKTSKK